MRTLYTPCLICKDAKGPTGMPGYYYRTSNEGTKVVKECDCHKAWIREEKIFIRAIDAHILKYDWYIPYSPLVNYKGTVSLNEVKKLVSYVEQYSGSTELRESCLYLQGGSCTQKTTLAHWIGLSLLKRGHSVYYTTLHHLVNDIVPSSFDKTEECREKAKKFLSVDCLIVDNAFNKFMTTLFDHQSPFVETLLRERIDENKKGTIFISDNSVTKIKENRFSAVFQEFMEHITKGKVLIFKDVYEKFDLSSIFSK